MKFKVSIEETIVQEFEVEADTEEEALDTAKEKYHNGQIVIENGEVQSRNIAITEPVDGLVEWNEF